MEQLLEIAVFIVGGGIGVVLFRFLKPKDIAKQNNEVIVKVEEKKKEIADLNKRIADQTTSAKQEIEEIEKEKQKDPSNQELSDFFNNRK